jgi:hypothetical protein
MWLSGERAIFPPKKGPASMARLRAQRRSIDRENREAIEVRKQWMQMLGLSESEISRDIERTFDLTLAEELEQLAAAITLAK